MVTRTATSKGDLILATKRGVENAHRLQPVSNRDERTPKTMRAKLRKNGRKHIAAKQVGGCRSASSRMEKVTRELDALIAEPGPSKRSNRGATQTMSRSVPGRRSGQQGVRSTEVRTRRGRGPSLLAPSRRGRTAPRLIGLPIAATVPKLRNLRWRFCTRWDEQPGRN